MALVAGFFYAYGSSVLIGLDALPPRDAVRAMQAINLHVRNWIFGPSFFGSLILPVITLLFAVPARRWSVAGWVAAAALLYGFGAFLLTLQINVPLNEALARVDPDQADIARIAREYFEPWRFWNWVRTLASTLALVCLMLAWREDGIIRAGLAPNLVSTGTKA